MQDAAARLGVSFFAVRNWQIAGTLPFATVKIGTRRLVPVAAMEEYVAGLVAAAASAPPAPAPAPVPAAPGPRRPGRPRKIAQAGGAK